MAKYMRHLVAVLAATALLMVACATRQTVPQVEGHYTYEHAFNYDLYGSHLDVHETGTMDFETDGSALDSARQVYTATLPDGGTVTYVFNYVSPSTWHLDSAGFHFAGIKESFRMEVVETELGDCDSAAAERLAQDIINVIGGSIDHEYIFQLDTLTDKLMQWSYTYRDGHSDTWELVRN